jgi:hypothetical protein
LGNLEGQDNWVWDSGTGATFNVQNEFVSQGNQALGQILTGGEWPAGYRIIKRTITPDPFGEFYFDFYYDHNGGGAYSLINFFSGDNIVFGYIFHDWAYGLFQPCELGFLSWGYPHHFHTYGGLGSNMCDKWIEAKVIMEEGTGWEGQNQVRPLFREKGTQTWHQLWGLGDGWLNMGYNPLDKMVFYTWANAGAKTRFYFDNIRSAELPSLPSLSNFQQLKSDGITPMEPMATTYKI